MNDLTEDEMLALDDGYREWSETIEKQNQEQQECVMLEYDSFEDFLADLDNPRSGLHRKLKDNGLQ